MCTSAFVNYVLHNIFKIIPKYSLVLDLDKKGRSGREEETSPKNLLYFSPLKVVSQSIMCNLCTYVVLNQNFLQFRNI